MPDGKHHSTPCYIGGGGGGGGGVASYPGILGKGLRKRTPDAYSLHMRLVKSPFCDDEIL